MDYGWPHSGIIHKTCVFFDQQLGSFTFIMVYTISHCRTLSQTPIQITFHFPIPKIKKKRVDSKGIEIGRNKYV